MSVIGDLTDMADIYYDSHFPESQDSGRGDALSGQLEALLKRFIEEGEARGKRSAKNVPRVVTQ
jgi:hypothetical protein